MLGTREKIRLDKSKYLRRFILQPRMEINVRQAKLSQAKVRQSGHFEQET
jgi:hypothetical protein